MEESRAGMAIDRTGFLNVTDERSIRENDERIPTSQQIDFSLQSNLTNPLKLARKDSSHQLDSLEGL